jgi:ribokinase
MSFENVVVIAVGGMNTDFCAIGLPYLAGGGELTYGGVLKIGPGGKSRNMAEMIATLVGRGKVAMISKTSRDKYNLWRAPVDALEQAGVNIEFIKVVPIEETNKLPCFALIAVDQTGTPQISVVPGITEDFLPPDIASAEPLFEAAKRNNGLVVLSLELPLVTAIATVRQANRCGLRVMLDPGGMLKGTNYQELLNEKIYLIKPNEHEAHMLTGIEVKSRSDALLAAQALLKGSIENVLVTLGADGALLVNNGGHTHISIPSIEAGADKDQTGCGDQSMAGLCAAIVDSRGLVEAARSAIIAGTLQFYKQGIVPITKQELTSASGSTSESYSQA